LILLAVANLTVLGLRLWPWQEMLNLPGNGTTAIDPVVCLLGYIALIFWISSNLNESIQKALAAGTTLGLLAGIFLVAQVVLQARPAAADAFHPVQVRIGLLIAAGLIWGIAGLRGSRVTGNAGIGLLSGAWSAMASCLMACAAVFAEMYLAGPPPESQDLWKQYEGLAIGNPAAQALVQSLNSATWFLLLGPLAGAGLGLIFAYFGHAQKA
jgi:hypothetical protein